MPRLPPLPSHLFHQRLHADATRCARDAGHQAESKLVCFLLPRLLLLLLLLPPGVAVDHDIPLNQVGPEIG